MKRSSANAVPMATRPPGRSRERRAGSRPRRSRATRGRRGVRWGSARSRWRHTGSRRPHRRGRARGRGGDWASEPVAHPSGREVAGEQSDSEEDRQQQAEADGADQRGRRTQIGGRRARPGHQRSCEREQSDHRSDQQMGTIGRRARRGRRANAALMRSAPFDLTEVGPEDRLERHRLEPRAEGSEGRWQVGAVEARSTVSRP